VGHGWAGDLPFHHHEVPLPACSHYRKANGAFIVFDVTRRSSFEHVGYWLENLRERGAVGLQIALVGHKIDSSRREVSSQ
jgi:Ras-related protein Rab-2A